LDNYRFIAINVAQIYYVLKTEYSHLFQEEKALLTTCGAIDTIVYIQEGSFTIEGIKNAVFIASIGKCALPFAEVTHERQKDITEAGLFFGVHKVENLLLNFTLQLECLIFHYEPTVKASDDVIIRSVLAKKKEIKNTIDKTLYNAGRGVIDPNIANIVNAFLNNPEYNSLRETIGL